MLILVSYLIPLISPNDPLTVGSPKLRVTAFITSEERPLVVKSITRWGGVPAATLWSYTLQTKNENQIFNSNLTISVKFLLFTIVNFQELFSRIQSDVGKIGQSQSGYFRPIEVTFNSSKGIFGFQIVFFVNQYLEKKKRQFRIWN